MVFILLIDATAYIIQTVIYQNLFNYLIKAKINYCSRLLKKYSESIFL